VNGEQCRLCGTRFRPVHRFGVLRAYVCAYGHTPADSLTTHDFCEPFVAVRLPRPSAPRGVIFRQEAGR
jgi:hypothetical protein